MMNGEFCSLRIMHYELLHYALILLGLDSFGEAKI